MGVVFTPGLLFLSLLPPPRFPCLPSLSHSLLHEMVVQAIALESNEKKKTHCEPWV